MLPGFLVMFVLVHRKRRMSKGCDNDMIVPGANAIECLFEKDNAITIMMQAVMILFAVTGN